MKASEESRSIDQGAGKAPFTVAGTGRKRIIGNRELEAMYPPIGTIIADPQGGLAFRVVFHNYGKKRITCELIGLFEPDKLEDGESNNGLVGTPAETEKGPE